MPQSTHDLHVGQHEVVKRFRSWDRDEASREWAGLTLLHRHAPGLAPEPLRRERDPDGAPVIVMSRVPGEPLGSGPLSEDQTRALAAALNALHSAVPAGELAGLPPRLGAASEMVGWLRDWAPRVDPTAYDEPVRSALDQARTWLGAGQVDRVTGPLAEPAFTLADGNLGNALWDGRSCRWVDFEDCGVSDPAYEVADVLEHVSVRLPGLVDPDALVAALAWPEGRVARLDAFRRLFAVFWLLRLLPEESAHDRNPPGSLERQAEWVRVLLRGVPEGRG